MIKVFLTLIIFSFSFLTVHSQPRYQKTFGGTSSDEFSTMIHTMDGGFMLAGRTFSFGAGSSDIYLVKLNVSGTIQWTKTIGGTGSDEISSILQTSDSGYLILGGTNSFGLQKSSIYILKLEQNGTIVWNKSIGGTYNIGASGIVKSADGGYVLSGNISLFGAGGTDMNLIKIDSVGTVIWAKSIGGTNTDYAWGIVNSNDGGFVIGGETKSFGAGDYDVMVLKMNDMGTIQWCKTIGSTLGDGTHNIIKTFDGGFMIAGYTASYGAGIWDAYLVKLDSNGILEWTKTYGGSAIDDIYDVVQTRDSGYAVAGYTTSFGAGSYDMLILKLSSNGSVQWSKAIGGTAQEDVHSIIQTSTGGYTAGGNTTSFGNGSYDFYFVMLDSNGITCSNSFTPSIISSSGGIISSATPNVAVPTLTTTSQSPTVGTGGTSTSVCIVTNTESNFNNIPLEYILYQNYPNPFNPVTKIKYQIPSDAKRKTSDVKLIIYDITGKEILTLVNEERQSGTHEVDFNGINFPSGVYFYKLIAGDFISTKKMLLIK